MRIIQSANPRPVNLLAVGPGGLVAAAGDALAVMVREVEVWDAATGERRFAYPSDVSPPRSVAFTPEGDFLVFTGYRGVTFVDATGAERLRTGAFIFPTFALSADGARLLVAGDQHVLQLWAVAAGPAVTVLWSEEQAGRGFLALALTGDGETAATAEQGADARGSPSLHLRLRAGDTGRVRRSVALDAASPARQLAFTADGAKLLLRTDDRKVQLFDAATGAAAGELVHPGRPFVTGIAVHPRGPVACARTNGTVTFWNPDTREQLRTFDWKTGRLVSVAFSPDGALAAAGTEDGKIVVWDVDL